MKLQKDSKKRRRANKITILRARVEKPLKERVAQFALKIERSEGYVVRHAVADFLDRNRKPQAA
jgi:predicted transcriptional regulator